MFKESSRPGSQLDQAENFTPWNQSIIEDTDELIQQTENKDLIKKNKELKDIPEFIELRNEMMENFGKRIAEEGDTDEKLTKLEKELARELKTAIENFNEKTL